MRLGAGRRRVSPGGVCRGCVWSCGKSVVVSVSVCTCQSPVVVESVCLCWV